MAKKEMKMVEDCSMCNSNPCQCSSSCGSCGNKWCKIFCALVVVVLGLLLIWPKGWFTYWNTVGLLIVLGGLRKFFHCCFECK